MFSVLKGFVFLFFLNQKNSAAMVDLYTGSWLHFVCYNLPEVMSKKTVSVVFEWDTYLLPFQKYYTLNEHVIQICINLAMSELNKVIKDIPLSEKKNENEFVM